MQKQSFGHFDSFPRIGELTYNSFSNRYCIDAAHLWILALNPSH